jgi:phage baseplate assembly protein V
VTVLLDRMPRPLRVRLANLVARAVVSLVYDAKKMQALQVTVLDGETRDAVERFQNYGFTSVPLEGAEVILLCAGGRREHAVAIAVDDRRHRLKGLADGEVALYHKDGAKVLLKSDGSIEISPKSGSDVVLAGGSAKVARKDDTTSSGELAMTGGTQLTWTPDGGSPVTIATFVPGSSGASFTPGVAATITGKITSGAEHSKA